MNIQSKLQSVAVAIALVILSACSTTPPQNAALNEARSLYQQASGNADVMRKAPLELEQARVALARADQTWANDRDVAETNHQAYMASQRTRLAMSAAEQRTNEARVQDASTERERLRADARTAEAEKAQQATRTAQMQTQSATMAARNESERANQLKQQLDQLSAKQTDHGLVVVLQDVLFDVGHATLRSGTQAKIEKIAEVLKNYPERRVRVQGFTDSTGSDETNMKLSQQRAEAVRNVMVEKGVGADRIEAQGLGEGRPVATNKTAAGRQQNRRVEVLFSDDQGRFSAL